MPLLNDRLSVFELHRADVAGLSAKEIAFIKSATHLSCDSRDLKAGSTFIAIRGEHHDGHHAIDNLPADTLAIVDKDYSGNTHLCHLIAVENTREFANHYAPVFYGYPAQALNMLGVTGTNGKTTSVYFLESIYQSLGHLSARIGTINIHYGQRDFPNPNTTPEPVKHQQTLEAMRVAGVKTVAMEVSSHGLELGRMQGVGLNGAVFTNLTRDHLDFHKTMEAYLASKLKIFELLKPGGRAACWNESSVRSRVKNEIEGLGFSPRLFGLDTKELFLSAEILSTKLSDTTLRISLLDTPIYEGPLKHVGTYNVLNLLSALSMSVDDIADVSHQARPQNKKEWKEIAQTPAFTKCIDRILKQGINKLVVPGRLETIENDLGALVVVDYAHTPDALENALRCLNALPHRNLVCVFGCGGDRDPSKRALMGKISGRLADHSIITSDNPRREDPQKILAMIEAGLKQVSDDYTMICDRREAIAHGLCLLQKKDIFLVAGKGHETYQIIGDKKIHFNDKQEIVALLKKINAHG